jgi:hypothetical protein
MSNYGSSAGAGFRAPRTRLAGTKQEANMAMKQSGRRGKSGNASGSRVKEATGGLKRRAGSSGGKHPKNKLFPGGTPPKLKRHPRARV